MNGRSFPLSLSEGFSKVLHSRQLSSVLLSSSPFQLRIRVLRMEHLPSLGGTRWNRRERDDGTLVFDYVDDALAHVRAFVAENGPSRGGEEGR